MTLARIVSLGGAVTALALLLGPSCSLENREGPQVTCADLDCGRANAFEQGIIAQCADGLTVRERDIHASELEQATECFVTSATREVMPVARLRLENGHEVGFPAGGGETTARVSRLYKAHVAGYVAAHAADSLW